jgi:hypothetical protein
MKKTVVLVFLVGLFLQQNILSQDYLRRTYSLKPGFILKNDITAGPGLNIISVPFSGFITGYNPVFGYYFPKNKIFAGSGTGVLIYNGGSMLPLYADIRKYSNTSFNLRRLINKNISHARKKPITLTPFGYFGCGALFELSHTDEENKFFVNAGFGLMYVLNNTTTFELSSDLFSQFGNSRDSFLRFKTGISYKFPSK